MTRGGSRRVDGSEPHAAAVRLRATLDRIRARLGPMQAEIRMLGAAEARRRLSAAETRRVTRIWLESEGLRLELAAVAEDFERLRELAGAG